MASTVVKNTPTGYKIGTAADQKVGFLGATPIVQRSGAAGAAVAAISGGEAPTEAEHNAVVALVNELRATLVAYGLHKGSA